MKHRNTFYGKCYYCICTACSGVICPFAHKLYRCCYRCQELRQRSPRLDCDYFSHYLKVRRFKFRRIRAQSLRSSGTYILNARGFVFVGKYDDLLPLALKLGVKLRKLDHFEFLSGDW